jgi:protein arginine N-methyltransferase 1
MHLYNVHAYGRMIADRVRTDAYEQALRQAVKPGSVVLDLGTCTGIWALLACRFGARKVYAVDKNDAIQLAREIAAANGFADRIEFIQEMSTRVTLPQRADVVVTEMHGVLPMFEQNVRSIIDARRRLMAPGGTIIPLRETLWAAVVEAPELYHRHMHPWDENRYGLDLRAGLRPMANTCVRCRVKPEQLLVKPACWATLHYAELDSPNVSGEVNWDLARTGTGHGLVVWFDTTLADGVRFSNAPDAPELIFGSAYFPWPEPVGLSAGDHVSVTLKANLVGDDYIWGWNTCVRERGRTGLVKAGFEQSNFFAAPLSAARLRKRAAAYVPARSEDGAIDHFILGLMDGATSLSDIASRVLAGFPGRFATAHDALTRVGELSEEYSA